MKQIRTCTTDGLLITRFGIDIDSVGLSACKGWNLTLIQTQIHKTGCFLGISATGNICQLIWTDKTHATDKPDVQGDISEHSENSRSREFSWESAWFFLARPWEMIFYFSFSSRNTRLKKEILVLVSKHEIERKNFSFSSRKTRFSFKFLNKSRCNILRKIKKLKVFFWKISVQAQATNQILVNSRENCLNLDSRSRLEVWDWR